MDEEYIGERTDAQGGRGARAAPSRQGQQEGRPAAGARSGWTARGGRGAQASATTRAAQGGGGACDGASEPPVEERAGGLVARRQGRVWDGSASVPTWTSGGGQGVTGRTTRDRARAVDAASATTSQTTQARCHTGTYRSSIADDWKHTISYLFIIPFTISYRASVADKEQTKSSRQRVTAPRAAILPMYLTSYGASRLSVIGRWRAA